MTFSYSTGTTIITGAGSGIGAALAVELAGRGASLALVDINEGGLATTHARLSVAGYRAAAYRADLGSAADIEALAARLVAEHSDINALVNNAGVGIIGTVEQTSLEDFEALFAVNFRGPVRLTKLLLPTLRAAAPARVVNVSSILGIIAAPGQAPYVASKFALRGFSETLAAELWNSGVEVSTVYPGGIATEIARSARLASGVDPVQARSDLEDYTKILATSPADAARQIADGAARGQARILIGKDARRADLLQRLAPARYPAIIRRLMGAR